MINQIILFVIKCCTKKTLTGRNRSYCEPSRGRLSNENITYINKLTSRNFNTLIKDAPRSKSFFNNLWMKYSVVILALYRAIGAQIDDSEYAKELTCDAMWKAFLIKIKPAIILTRLLLRNRQRQLNFMLTLSFKYFFYPKEFKIDLKATRNCMYVTLKSCWMHEYYKQVGNKDEMNFFRRSFCAFDTDFINVIINGKTKYERSQQLSTGGTECDMKWSAV